MDFLLHIYISTYIYLIYIIYVLHKFIYLKGRWTERKGEIQRERERCSISRFIVLKVTTLEAGTGLGQELGTSSSLPHRFRPSRTLPGFCCIPMSIYRKLDQKHRIWNSNLHSNMQSVILLAVLHYQHQSFA